VANELPKHLKNLEVLGKLYGNGGPFFVGNNLTRVDLLVYVYVEFILQMSANALDTYPWLKQNRVAVEATSKIAEYLKNQSKTVS
jgi:glutathione S-transferase